MTLLSAAEDFGQTLQALSGHLAKLRYIAGLQTSSGDYSHWGLERTHTPEKARAAIQAAHRQVFKNVLKTPVRILAAQAKVEEDSKGKDLTADALQPSAVSAGAALHFNSVLLALANLAPESTRPAA